MLTTEAGIASARVNANGHKPNSSWRTQTVETQGDSRRVPVDAAHHRSPRSLQRGVGEVRLEDARVSWLGSRGAHCRVPSGDMTPHLSGHQLGDQAQ